MATIQVWIPPNDLDYYMDILNKMKEFYRDEVVDQSSGAPYHIIKRELARINNSYVIREAIKEWGLEIESLLEKRRRYRNI